MHHHSTADGEKPEHVEHSLEMSVHVAHPGRADQVVLGRDTQWQRDTPGSVQKLLQGGPGHEPDRAGSDERGEIVSRHAGRMGEPREYGFRRMK